MAVYHDLEQLQKVASRVVRAFEALGKADGFMDSHAAHLECERAMVALKDQLAAEPTL